ncbi:phosphoribosylformylglycinamidine synthase subunit PurS [Tepidibacillus marianensis]|uniref:phosphoribosylformylglycinamidine synthase subunit PurS n=1 Tax=Tepidibacillus marianensis TaxID=3131995 RepID=UPI0030CAD229
MYKARVYVTLKNGILDPQGKAVKGSLQSLGYDEVQDVRVGKFIELQVNTQQKEVAEERIKEMCEKLLANLVIEDYQFQIEEVAS